MLQKIFSSVQKKNISTNAFLLSAPEKMSVQNYFVLIEYFNMFVININFHSRTLRNIIYY